MAGAQAHGVQTLHDGGGGQPGGVLLEDIPDGLGTFGLNDIVLVGVHGEAQRAGAAQGLALEGRFPHATAGFFGQLGAVILSQSFHQALNDDALGTGDVALGGIEDLHTVVPELFLIDGAVVAVAGQAVGFPADHGVKGVRRTVGHQLLEGRAVIGFAADMAVYILAQDGHAVGAGVGLTVPTLALDALLGLTAAARVAVVSHQARRFGRRSFFAGHDNTSFPGSLPICRECGILTPASIKFSLSGFVLHSMFPRRCIVPVPGFLLAHIQKACYAVRAGDAWKETFLFFYPYLLTTGQPPPAGNGWRGLCVYKTRSTRRGAP